MFGRSKVKATPLAMPPFGRQENTVGMEYGMAYYTILMPAPNVSPLQRQSLGQPVLRHRAQNSHYNIMPPVSWSAMADLDYPYFKSTGQVVQTNSASSTRPTPVTAKRSFFAPGTAQGDGMAPMPRFRKALPLPINQYTPPVYGG